MKYFQRFNFYFLVAISIVAWSFDVNPLSAQSKLDLRELTYNPIYQTKSVPGFRFLDDGRHYAQLNQNSIEKVDIVTGEVTEVLFSSTNSSQPIQESKSP